MEALFFNRKKEKDSKRELKKILEKKSIVNDERKLDDIITTTLKEWQTALNELGLVNSNDFTKLVVDKVKQVDKWMGTRFKKSAMASDMATRIKHLAYAHMGYGSTLSYFDVDIEPTDVIKPDDILYAGDTLVIYANQYSKGPLHVVTEERWQFDFRDLTSRTRNKAVEAVRTGLQEYLMHVYRKLDKESIWTDADGHVNYNYDDIAGIEDPYEAVFKYDRVVAEYPDGGGNSVFIVDDHGEIIVIDVDHETTAITVH